MFKEGSIVIVKIYPHGMRISIDLIDGTFGTDIPYTKLSQNKNFLIVNTKDPLMHKIKLSPVCVGSKALWKIEEISL